jgi:dihydrodipicolinate synthase/N-acetylneuraminate lyase
MTAPHRGLFAIPPTPFTADGAFDEASLRRTIAFCLEAGTHGIVTPVNASEFSTLTSDERHLVTRVTVEEIARAGKHGHVPAVIGVCAPTTAEAVGYARHAADAGADAVISMPAYGEATDEDTIFAFYAAIANVVAPFGIPVYIQNHEKTGGIGHPMSAEFVTRLCVEIGPIQYVKEESFGTGPKISHVLANAGGACLGIMGGKAGRYLFDEVRRGACGTMPACESADVHALVWNLIDDGRLDDARTLFNDLLPLLNIEAAFGTAVYKEVLFRRRIIASPFKRLPGLTLDAIDQEELDVILDALAPHFTVRTPTRRP